MADGSLPSRGSNAEAERDKAQQDKPAADGARSKAEAERDKAQQDKPAAEAAKQTAENRARQSATAQGSRGSGGIRQGCHCGRGFAFCAELCAEFSGTLELRRDARVRRSGASVK